MNDPFLEYDINELYEEFYGPKDDLDEDEEEHDVKKVRCECGAKKAKTTHADWCPKYEK